MAADGRSCSARALAVQTRLPLELDTAILRLRSFLVLSAIPPAMVVCSATADGRWLTGRLRR